MGPIEDTASTVDARNRATSAREVASFTAKESERWFAYPSADGQRIVTWMGDTLADVRWWGAAFRSGFGDERQNFRARGIDGRMWSGTQYGTYVRMSVARTVML